MFAFSKLASFCLVAITLQQSVSAIPHNSASEQGHHLESVLPQQFDVDTSANVDVPVFDRCDANQQVEINTAYPAAQAHIANAYAYVNQFGGVVPPANDARLDRYKTWFGEFSDARFREVVTRVTALYNAHYDRWTYKCDFATCRTDMGTIPGTLAIYAYVTQDPAEREHVQLCPPFFSALQSSGITRAHVLIHEAAHFDAFNLPGANAFTAEWYTSAGAWALARGSPDKAIRNADNYAWFARNAKGCDLLRCSIL